MQLRWAKDQDAAALADVFFRSVRDGQSPYTQAQREAWMPMVPDIDKFRQRLADMHVVLACSDTQPVGFLAMQPDGYIDLAYILEGHRKRGLFRQLFDILEKKAASLGLARLRVHASLTAQPAFRAVCFSVIQHETVERAGQFLRRAEMEKTL